MFFYKLEYKSSLDSIQTGGLMAILTDFNPHFAKADRMVGNVICFEDDNRFIITDELTLKINFLTVIFLLFIICSINNGMTEPLVAITFP